MRLLLEVAYKGENTKDLSIVFLLQMIKYIQRYDVYREKIEK
jgi:hypothetical protein